MNVLGRQVLGPSALILMLGMMGCWSVVGVDDRQVTRCDYPFVESSSTECQTCFDQSCCGELERCAASQDCLDCTGLSSGPGTACAFPDEFTGLRSCVHDHCQESCYPRPFNGEIPAPDTSDGTPQSAGACVDLDAPYSRFRCNPVTGEPCDVAAGEACAFDYMLTTFSCHTGGRQQGAGEVCGLVEGLCAPGFDCADGLCYRYCCGDEDCGIGRCFTFSEKYPEITIGVCVVAE